MMLLVDIGNTRVKWAACVAGALEPQQAAEYAHWTVEDWQRTLFGPRRIDRVVAASVAGEHSSTAPRRRGATQRRDRRPVHRVDRDRRWRAQRLPGPAPARRRSLGGRDRRLPSLWRRVLRRRRRHGGDGGWGGCRRARHLGGYIVPGPHMMVRSLHVGTSATCFVHRGQRCARRCAAGRQHARGDRARVPRGAGGARRSRARRPCPCRRGHADADPDRGRRRRNPALARDAGTPGTGPGPARPGPPGGAGDLNGGARSLSNRHGTGHCPVIRIQIRVSARLAGASHSRRNA